LCLAEVITHALGRDPEECCGLLLERRNTVRQLRRIRDIHESRVNRFKMARLDVIEAERDVEGAGKEFVAIDPLAHLLAGLSDGY
jgi:proteasome lid subunit RPN8/RPN11